jgi:hypothetical protein
MVKHIFYHVLLDPKDVVVSVSVGLGLFTYLLVAIYTSNVFKIAWNLYTRWVDFIIDWKARTDRLLCRTVIPFLALMLLLSVTYLHFHPSVTFPLMPRVNPVCNNLTALDGLDYALYRLATAPTLGQFVKESWKIPMNAPFLIEATIERGEVLTKFLKCCLK